MISLIDERFQRFVREGDASLLRNSRIGLEKENLRVGTDGHIAQTAHPHSLGSALTHPSITTDYSEALLECITPPYENLSDALDYLRHTHCFVYENIKDEFLWAASMPCVVEGEASIPLARYGSSNVGTMKTVYRRGLGHRYGRVMQVIAGAHFNFSFSDEFWKSLQSCEQDTGSMRSFIDRSYFGLIRNLQRVGWLVPYLFGSSPAVCKSFMGGQPTELLEFDSNTYYGPYATSLRMSDIGYKNTGGDAPGVVVNYDSLDSYVRSLTEAIETGHSAYEKFGVEVDGVYQQLNTNVLQIENEYYSSVRPKPLLRPNEKPTLALKKRGVQYVELRSLDLNVFEPLGMSESQLQFLELLMTYCLFADSPCINSREHDEINQNFRSVAVQGRDPSLRLQRAGSEIDLRTWANETCDAMEDISGIMDRSNTDHPYAGCLQKQRAVIADPDQTPSARVIAGMREHKEGFFHFAKRWSQQHREGFSRCRMGDELHNKFATTVSESLLKQQAIEKSDDCDFGEFLARYFAQK